MESGSDSDSGHARKKLKDSFVSRDDYSGDIECVSLRPGDPLPLLYCNTCGCVSDVYVKPFSAMVRCAHIYCKYCVSAFLDSASAVRGSCDKVVRANSGSFVNSCSVCMTESGVIITQAKKSGGKPFERLCNLDTACVSCGVSPIGPCYIQSCTLVNRQSKTTEWQRTDPLDLAAKRVSAAAAVDSNGLALFGDPNDDACFDLLKWQEYGKSSESHGQVVKLHHIDAHNVACHSVTMGPKSMTLARRDVSVGDVTSLISVPSCGHIVCKSCFADFKSVRSSKCMACSIPFSDFRRVQSVFVCCGVTDPVSMTVSPCERDTRITDMKEMFSVCPDAPNNCVNGICDLCYQKQLELLRPGETFVYRCHLVHGIGSGFCPACVAKVDSAISTRTRKSSQLAPSVKRITAGRDAFVCRFCPSVYCRDHYREFGSVRECVRSNNQTSWTFVCRTCCKEGDSCEGLLPDSYASLDCVAKDDVDLHADTHNGAAETYVADQTSDRTGEDTCDDGDDACGDAFDLNAGSDDSIVGSQDEYSASSAEFVDDDSSSVVSGVSANGASEPADSGSNDSDDSDFIDDVSSEDSE